MKKEEIKYYLPAIYLVLKHTLTPLAAKIMAGITVCYALSPIDLIPDFVPILGYLDDVIILPLLITLTLKLIPQEIMNECLEQSKDMWKNGKPKNWKYAIPIILIYILIILIILKQVV